MKTFSNNKQRLSRITQKLIKINYNRLKFKNYEEIMLTGNMQFEN
jgi:hypothetical protein